MGEFIDKTLGKTKKTVGRITRNRSLQAKGALQEGKGKLEGAGRKVGRTLRGGAARTRSTMNRGVRRTRSSVRSGTARARGTINRGTRRSYRSMDSRY